MKQTEGCEACARRRERTPEELRALTHRLNRVEGQIRGIRHMLESDAYCPDILNQVAAAASALKAFGMELLDRHIHTCVTQDLREGREETLEELMGIIQKMVR